MTFTVQAEITLSLAQQAYNRVSNHIRDRHNDKSSPESWEMATSHAVMRLQDWEAVAVMRYLATRTGLPDLDVILANALAARLGLTLTFERKEIV